MRALARTLAALTVSAAVALLAACGTASADSPAGTRDRPAGPAASAGHNAADVEFLQLMIAHLGQARQLTELAAERAVRDEVRVLAAAIQVTQADEVKIMESWLRGWREPTAMGDDAAAAHAAHGGHGGLPAIGREQVEQLRGATGVQFETMFLSLLTGHQHGAVELARQVAAGGENPETKELAERITQSRTEQIAQLLRLMNA